MKIQRLLLSFLIALIFLALLSSCRASSDNQDTQNDDTAPDIFGVESGNGNSLIDFTLTQESVASLKVSLYPEFNTSSTPSVLIPGLKQYLVPQGMDYWADMNWLMISGYFSDTEFSKSSVIVAVDLATGKFIGEYFIKNSDGIDHASHVGGVAVTKNNLYISNAGQLHRIPLTSITAAGQSGNVNIAQSINVPVNASYCNYSGGILWVGEFQYGTSYKTDSSHHMKNRDGDMYYAWTIGYKLDESTENEFKSTATTSTYAIPDYILSITERIQGMTVLSDDYIILSQSYGRKNDSTLFIYNNPLSQPQHSNFTYNGISIPVWFLDNTTGVKELKTPPMAEGIASIDEMLYVLYESGADIYRNDGGKNPTDRVFIVDVTKAIN